MTCTRFCRKCKEYTLQDKIVYFGSSGNKANTFERVFFGLFTLGVSESLNQKVWKCQQCDSRIEI